MMNSSTFVFVLVSALVMNSIAESLDVKECQKPIDGLLERIKLMEHHTLVNISNNGDDKYGAKSVLWVSVLDRLKSEPTNGIVVHADPSLMVNQVHYYQSDKRRMIDITNVCRDSGKQLLAITLDENLPLGSIGAVAIDVTAHIRKDGRGLFKSTDGSIEADFTKSLARYAFPCLDDENIKSIEFYLQVVHDWSFEIDSSILIVDQRDIDRKMGDLVLSIFKPEVKITLNRVNFKIRHKDDDKLLM